MKELITLYIPSLNLGGIAKNTIRLAKGLIAMGYDVDVVVVNYKGEYVKDLPSEINIVNLNSKKAMFSIPKLVSYLRRKRPKALISANDYTNIIAIIAKKLSAVKCKLIISVRTNVTTHCKNAKSIKERLLVPLLIKKAYPLSDYIVSVSKGVQEDLVSNFNIPENKSVVIYNPIFDESILEKKLEEPNHIWFGKANTILLSAGRLTQQKDYPTLIKAFAEFRKTENSKSVKLIILGEGPERDNLQKLINKLNLTGDVDLLGYVSNPYSYMGKADLFVLPSKWEGFGNVLVEALSCGVNVITTNCPSGPMEIINYGEFGTFVPVGDYKKMSDKIKDTLNNSPKISAETLVKRGKEFSISKTASEYLELVNG
ncbi:glycosyltransferase [Proteinivorax tanatarense]|uniref:Glycosyltransferase n=1 Tax=Proteinivorax tanatarense TaxID=1260629 RepID=A0AAU7VI83_9FIRM